MNPIPGCRGVETYYIMSFVLYPGAQTYVIYDLQYKRQELIRCTFSVLYLEVLERM